AIYTYEFILSTAGIVIEGNDFVYLENMNDTTEEKAVAPTTSGYAALSTDELKTKLQEALSEEAYEKAAKIRDELNRRKAS
ncbi:MAG: UvrB/UvrC motif-containing protein, partial [Mucilaginibacter sp.]|nr:UvrB/UvrC motif-containing protein [Mucilaginibacter sp.]